MFALVYIKNQINNFLDTNYDLLIIKVSYFLKNKPINCKSAF